MAKRPAAANPDAYLAGLDEGGALPGFAEQMESPTPELFAGSVMEAAMILPFLDDQTRPSPPGFL